jgi:outer membrane protein assembly factor BamD (BamD/ComL family)
MIFTHSHLYLGLLSVVLLGATGCMEKKQTKEVLRERKSNGMAELLRKRESAIAMKNKDLEAAVLEQLIIQYADNENSKNWRFELGKMYEEMEEYALAYRVYRDYTKLYPSDLNTEAAAFLAINAKYNQTVKMRQECDGSEALKTIKLCKSYLNQPFFQTHQGAVQDIQKTCENRLVNKDVYVFNTYLMQGKLASAKARLDTIKEKYKEAPADVQSQCLFLEYKLAKAENNNQLAKTIHTTLQEQFPNSTAEKMASSEMRTFA